MTYKLMLTWADPAKPVQVIKTIRALSGLGLKEAKDVVDKFRDDQHPVLLSTYESAAKAREALHTLCKEGYADGSIEQTVGASETVYSKAEVVLMLADAVSLARDQSHWKPSVIVNSVLGT